MKHKLSVFFTIIFQSGNNLVALLVIFGVAGCSEEKSKTTDTFSSQFSTLTEKINFLGKYLNIKNRKITDTEYHIVYHDNSQGLAAPSDWQMTIALKVPENEVERWIEDCKEAEDSANPSQWYKVLALDTLKWAKEEPDLYKSTTCNAMQSKIICRKNGFVFLSYSSFTE